MYNLKKQKFEPATNYIYNKKFKPVTKDLAASITPIVINESALNTPNKKLKSRNFSYSAKFNSSPRTSTMLLTNHSSLINVSIKHLGTRHISSEATLHVPKVQLTGFWKDISESAPVQFAQDSLIGLQTATDLPWWATIILTTFIVRGTLTLPLSLYQHYILAKVQNLQIEMSDAVEKFKHEANVAVSHYNWSEFHARMVYNQAVKNKWDELIQRENCHPAKGFIVLWTQIPLWISISAALRNLCYMLPPGHTNAEAIFLQLTTGGFGWVVNLIDVDHYWIIPISVGLFNLTNIEVMSLMKMKEDTRLQKYLLYFMRFISIAMIPIATYVPSCICLYWASSSAFGLMQNLTLLSPKVRRLAGVPWTSTEREHPYRDLVAKFRAKKYINFSRKSTSSK